MDKNKALVFLKTALTEISDGNNAKTDDFSGLREVDAKVREIKMVMEGIDDLPRSILESMKNDPDFQANSRRVRLETLIGYVKNAIKFIDTGAFDKPKKIIHPPPNYSALTSSMSGLTEEIDRRWREAQKCVHIEAYTSAVILMGSILEGLLLARTQNSAGIAYQSSRAPKDKTGKGISIPNWTLSTLIDVATDVGWIKTDRGKFGHALRESRNVVHPWQAVSIRADFDEATCKTAWQVLEASVDDLLRSL